ncbi:MAG TPA: hypothetical protein VM370_09620 [Candidatus Thermoplasmatota archaeon]|nr:hypothetical protein [Candidatus Thermoplasmatota archaeon]
MRGRSAIAAALLMIAAGCMGAADEAPTAVATPDADAGVVVAPDGTVLSPAHFAGATAVDLTTWYNGTFTVQDLSRPVPFGPGPSDLGLVPPPFKRIDITKDVPTGVPVRIIAQVDAAITQGDVDLWPEVPDGEWRTGNWDTPRGGHSRVEVGIAHESSDPVAIVLAYDEAEPAQEFAYTLSVRIVSDPTLLVNGIVTGVTLPAEPRLSIELVGEKREREIFDRIDVMAFAPDDTYLGSFPLAESGASEVAFPAGSPAGEYVFLLTQGGRNARILVADANGSAPMRAVGQEFVNGDVVVGDASGHAKWTTDYDRVPLLVGLNFRSPNAAQNVAVKLDGPKGPLLDDAIEGGPWMSVRLPDGTSISDGFGWDTGYGAPGLDKGTYTHEVTFTTSGGPDNVEGQSMAAFYTR